MTRIDARGNEVKVDPLGIAEKDAEIDRLRAECDRLNSLLDDALAELVVESRHLDAARAEVERLKAAFRRQEEYTTEEFVEWAEANAMYLDARDDAERLRAELAEANEHRRENLEWARGMEAACKKLRAERDEWKARYDLMVGEARKVNRAWKDEFDRAERAEKLAGEKAIELLSSASRWQRVMYYVTGNSDRLRPPFACDDEATK
jgi:chromosome segregation ATPase